MAASHILIITVWVAISSGIALCCPELCTCADKHGRHFADCYKDLIEIPNGFPPNVSTLSLSANRIPLITAGSFDNVTQVTSLWMAHNEIVSIEEGSLAALVNLRNFDISHNRIVDFPWLDLQNLTALQMLKMNHNEMVSLPKNAFSNLRDLKSLRLNNNRFTTIAEGMFDGLMFLTYLQIFHNPFACTCTMDWLRDWILNSSISIPEQNHITCATPRQLEGAVIVKLPESKCMAPSVSITSEPDVVDAPLYEDTTLALTCEFKGNPQPTVVWKINTKSRRKELVVPSEEDDSAESDEDIDLTDDQFKVFSNGTLLIFRLSEKHCGNYSCSATNEFGKSEDFLSVEVMALPKPTPTLTQTVVATPVSSKPNALQPPIKTSIFKSFHLPDLERKDINKVVSSLPSSTEAEPDDQTPRLPSRPNKCSLSRSTQYISNHAFNGSLDNVKQYTFDFGVIALGVTETDVKVRLNPLLMPKDKTVIHSSSSEVFHAINRDPHGLSEEPENVSSKGLYLCVTADRKHSAVQWSRIEEGVNTYQFRGLRPGTNYSLCLTHRGDDCEVQVLFATRRRVANLLIIISVSICLLTVSTVPLLGATCFHLVYKYRGKTYKLIMKAKDQYHMERNLAANFNIHTPYTDSQSKINGSELDEDEGVSESGEKDEDVEGSVVTESFTLSQSKGNLDDFELGSEYSDRLPLGAEAVNITSNYKYPMQ